MSPTTTSNSQPKPSWWASLCSLGFLFAILAAVANPGIFFSAPKQATRRHHRRDLNEQAHGDTTARMSSNEDCRAYVLKFLNGTTDERDECAAFHNAYAGAGCPRDRDPAKDEDVLRGTTTAECCDNIERFYLRNCETHRANVSALILGIIGVLLLCVVAKALLDCWRVSRWIPDACAFILVGGSLALLQFLTKESHPTMVYDHFYFDEAFFMQVLLPPTIFQAALSIDKPSFGRHLGPILLFAILGTALSSVTIGWMTHWLTSLCDCQTLPLLESMVFGALISSIDPVATLGILSGVGVDPTGTLYALIFGESLLNDGVAIVLFETLESHLGDEAAIGDPNTYYAIAADFFKILSGSLATALVVGLCAVAFFFLLRGRQLAVTEVVSFIGWALVPYYVSEALGFSGILAILAMGFIMDFYILGHGHAGSEACIPITWQEILGSKGLLSPQCSAHIGFIAHTVASTMETLIFAYLGIFVFDDKVYNVALEQVAIWTCIISRAAMVILLSWIVNVCTSWRASRQAEAGEPRSNPVMLDRRTQIMLFLAGIRGAVSFALVSKIPVYDVFTQEGTKFKSELKAMTSTAIIFTLFVFGALASVVVDRPSQPSQTDNPDQLTDNIDATEPLTSAKQLTMKDYSSTNNA